MAPLPPPTSVEMYRLPSGPSTALRSRTPFARIGVAKDTSPLPSRNITRALASFRNATASAPFQDFHCVRWHLPDRVAAANRATWLGCSPLSSLRYGLYAGTRVRRHINDSG